MIIQISGRRKAIAELAFELRMEGFRFEYYQRNPLKPREHQTLTLGKYSGDLGYFKIIPPEDIAGEKSLKVHLPTHRNYFIKKVREHYVEKRKKAV